MTNQILRTPDYSTFNHNGAQYVRLDQTDPQTGRVKSLIIIPDQLSPADKLHYVSFMCKKAEIDQQEMREQLWGLGRQAGGIKEQITGIAGQAREVEEQLKGIRKNLEVIVEERNEVKKKFIEFLKEKKKTEDAINAYIHREGFCTPVLHAFSSMVNGIKSFFS